MSCLLSPGSIFFYYSTFYATLSSCCFLVNPNNPVLGYAEVGFALVEPDYRVQNFTWLYQTTARQKKEIRETKVWFCVAKGREAENKHRHHLTAIGLVNKQNFVICRHRFFFLSLCFPVVCLVTQPVNKYSKSVFCRCFMGEMAAAMHGSLFL